MNQRPSPMHSAAIKIRSVFSAVEEVAEPAPLLADPILRGDPEIADRHRVGVVLFIITRIGSARTAPFASRRSTRNSESPRVFFFEVRIF